jgi:curved DNA-binding protein
VPEGYDSRRVYVRPPGGGFGGIGSAGGGIDDLLGSLFGWAGPGMGGFGSGMGGFGAGVSTPGADSEAEIELSVEEAYAGGRRRIMLQTAAGARSYEVTIPAGVTDGQRIRLAGQGTSGLSGGPRGDLYLVVRLAPHPRYRVDGRDITVDLPVAPWEAAVGASVPVATRASSAQVQVPPGSSSGRRLRLRGRGMPNPTGAPGDLYAKVRIIVPARPSAAERELWQRLADAARFDARGERAGAKGGR